MESKTSNVELIDKFIENEHKSKRFTILSVGLFMLMALLVLFFAFKLNSTNKRLGVTEAQLKIANDSLFAMNNQLMADTSSKDRTSREYAHQYDSLKEAFEMLAQLFNKSQADQFNNDTAAAKEQLNKISNELFNTRSKKSVELIKDVVLRPQDLKKVNTDPLVFIQYMPDFVNKVGRLVPVLQKYGFKVQPQQQINDFTFNPEVKYFYPEDEDKAKEILKLVNNSNPFFQDHPAVLTLLKTKAPYHQVEVWIGQYQANDERKYLYQVQKNLQQIKN